jgi:hypothetical protein
MFTADKENAPIFTELDSVRMVTAQVSRVDPASGELSDPTGTLTMEEMQAFMHGSRGSAPAKPRFQEKDEPDNED